MGMTGDRRQQQQQPAHMMATSGSRQQQPLPQRETEREATTKRDETLKSQRQVVRNKGKIGVSFESHRSRTELPPPATLPLPPPVTSTCNIHAACPPHAVFFNYFYWRWRKNLCCILRGVNFVMANCNDLTCVCVCGRGS